MNGCMCRLHQGGAEPGTAFASSPAQAFARTLVVAWTQSCPRRQMPCIGKPAHVGSNLSQEHFGDAPLDSWNRRQPLELPLVGMDAHRNLPTQTVNGFLYGVNVGELFAQQEAVVRLEVSRQ